MLIHDGSGWVELPAATQTWRVLAASAVAISHTGNTAKTTLASVTIPGGAMGANGCLRITSLWSHSDNANDKTPRVEFGGAPYYSSTITTSATTRMYRSIANRNGENSQVGGAASGAFNWGSTPDALTTSSVDTLLDQDLVFSGQLANSGDTISLESYLVELLYQA